ncbi:MAG: hypothetical protein ABGY75_03535, partial [Gemmataceae bacterium]
GFGKVQSTAAHAAHRAHLETALADIRVAEADAKAGRTAAAEKATAAAIQQVHAAVGYHAHSKQLHQHHHPHLTAALADLRAAEKQLKGGHTAKAENDLAKAAHQLREALGQHHGKKKTVAKK